MYTLITESSIGKCQKHSSTDLYDAMVAVYGDHAPFDRTDERFPINIYKRAIADQRRHGAYLRADEACTNQSVYCSGVGEQPGNLITQDSSFTCNQKTCNQKILKLL